MAYFRFPKLSDLKDPKRRLQLILLSGAVLMGFLFFNAIFWPLTSNPRSCMQFCHSMNREYYTWQRSSHSNITCTACHVEQGLIPFFIEKVEGPLGVIAEITGNYEKPLNKESELGFHKMSKETCDRCHNLEKRTVTPSLIFKDKMVGSGKQGYHAKHLKKGMACTLCHNRITHKGVNDPEILKLSGFSPNSEEASVQYKDGMSMTEGCFRCHSPFPKEHDKHLIEKYKAEEAPKTCRTCHPKFMLPMGHGKNWTKEHPSQALKVGFEFCWKCHAKGKRFDSIDGKRSRCRDCHHRIIAKQVLVLDSCKKCHEEMAFTQTKLVDIGSTARRKFKQRKKAQYYRRMVYHKVHFPKKYKCTECHLSDLETTKKSPFELCKNDDCHPPGQIKPPSGSKLCNKCHISPHSK